MNPRGTDHQAPSTAPATTYSVDEAARLLGIHRETAYLQIAAGTFPVAAIRLGRRLRIPAAPLHRLLGIATPDGDDSSAA